MPVKFLERMVRFFLYGTAFTPLIVLSFFVFPSIVPKVIFLRILVVLAAAGYGLLIIYKRKEYGIYSSLLIYTLILFFISASISTFVGVDWHMSFWNNQERMLGFFTLVHYGLFYLIARRVLNKDELWTRMMTIVGGVGMIVVFVGIVQKINPDFLFNRGAGRVISTLGNPIYLAGYGLFLMFIGMLNSIQQKGRIRWFFVSVASLGLIGIFISGTRGTLLGLIAGLFVGAILYTIRWWNNKKVKMAAFAIIILGLLLGGLFFVYRQTQFIQNLPVIGSLSSASFQEGTGKTRVMAWKIAIDAWKEKPIFGWGPNNFSYAFSKYYNPEFLQFGFQETWFDNAHNVLLNMLSTQGLFGLISYLGLFVVCWYSLWRMYKNDSRHVHTVIIISSFLIAHFVHNIFAFENITSYWYFFLLLAYIDWFAYAPRQSATLSLPQKIPLKVVLPVVLGCFAIIFFTNINVAWGNIYEYKARYAMSLGKVKESLIFFETGKKIWNPYQFDVSNDIAMDILGVLSRVYTYDTELARKIYDTAVENMRYSIQIHPLDVRSYLGLTDLLRSGGLVLFKLPVEEEIKQYLETAHRLSPERQEIKYAEITFIAGTGDIDRAIAEAQKLVEEDKMIAEGYYTLGRLYYFSQQYKKILKTMDEAIDAGIRWSDPAHQIFAAETYEREGRFLDALYWYDRAYKVTGNERIKYKRDELSRQTQLSVPKNLEEFFFSQIKRYD